MSLDSNERGTYKNKTATREMDMSVFLKDFMALVSIAGFTGALFTWMDLASKLA
jgi:hypothetical protein